MKARDEMARKKESWLRAAMLKTFGKIAAPAFAILAAFAGAQARAEMLRFATARTAPPPLRMDADVGIARGTSTSMHLSIDVARLTGAEAPRTYSGDLIGPYPGFHWFVSRHYAILSDMDDGSVGDALALLELAWPHYVRTFRWRPPASETHRQAIVLASSRSALEDCLLHDAIHAKLLGGLTLEGFGCAYLYAGSPYQTRYILLHEATHLYQYSLSGDTRGCYGFLLEGIADFLSSHIYDPHFHALTVNVLDRAPIHNHLADGLADWRKLGQPTFSAHFDNPSPSRGLSVLMTAFLQHTPEYEAKWRLFCERIVRDMALKDAKRTTLAALRDLYGDPASLDAPFAKWIASLKPTFNLLDRDFDQSAPNAFTALPPSNATARLAIETASLPLVSISRPVGSGASAGFSFKGETFAMSNTWSGGCVFTFSSGAETRRAEVPVAFMRGYEHYPRFDIALARNGDKSILTVQDWLGEPVTPPLTNGWPKDAQARAPKTLTLFATGSPVEFEFLNPLPGMPARMNHLLDIALARIPSVIDMEGELPAPETTFPDFAGAVTEWEVLGPLPASAKADAIPANDAALWADDGTRLRWRRVAAHPATPITPPLVNLNEVFGRQANNLVAYARASISAEADGEAAFVFGVADGVEVFVNGQKVGTRTGRREWSDGNLRIEGVKLRKGRNDLVLRLAHADSAWLLSARKLLHIAR